MKFSSFRGYFSMIVLFRICTCKIFFPPVIKEFFDKFLLPKNNNNSTCLCTPSRQNDYHSGVCSSNYPVRNFRKLFNFTQVPLVSAFIGDSTPLTPLGKKSIKASSWAKLPRNFSQGSCPLRTNSTLNRTRGSLKLKAPQLLRASVSPIIKFLDNMGPLCGYLTGKFVNRNDITQERE